MERSVCSKNHDGMVALVLRLARILWTNDLAGSTPGGERILHGYIHRVCDSDFPRRRSRIFLRRMVDREMGAKTVDDFDVGGKCSLRLSLWFGQSNPIDDRLRICHAILLIRNVVSSVCLYSGALSHDFESDGCRICQLSRTIGSSLRADSCRFDTSNGRPDRCIRNGSRLPSRSSAVGRHPWSGNERQAP